ncbi:MAG TPA: hypothetical protein VGD62_02315, partial [Acidobacteriaceae bacterium]
MAEPRERENAAGTVLPAPTRRWLSGLVVECELPGCRAFHVAHRWLRARPGIFLDGQWYCSPACLGDALAARLGTEDRSAAASVGPSGRLPFRLRLLARGTVDEAQLETARSAALPGEELGDTLLRLGSASEAEIAAARAEEAGCGFYGGPGWPIEPEFRVPASLMKQYQAVPMHHAPASGRLLVGFLYRVDAELLRMIEQATGCRSEACFVTRQGYGEQLARLEGGPVETRTSAVTRQRAGAALVRHAVQSGAESMRVA